MAKAIKAVEDARRSESELQESTKPVLTYSIRVHELERRSKLAQLQLQSTERQVGIIRDQGIIAWAEIRSIHQETLAK